ncbi:Uncharacterised protein [uncultured archaeon]|nr:Uncharacterised protein [uncultured archaeon]
MINATYLVRNEEDLKEIKGKIKKLEKVISFSCPPVPNPNNMFPENVIVKKGRAGDYDSCDISPFPGCELSLINLQKENISKPEIDLANQERIVLSYDSDIYTIYFKNNF